MRLLFTCSILFVATQIVACKPEMETITRDVVIIGGGASGVYAATQLQGLGKSFAVIEQNSQFGGHTQTYTLPGTEVTIDLGVQAYTSIPSDSYTLQEQFFATWNISVVFGHISETSLSAPQFMDFRTFTTLDNFTFDSDLSSYTSIASQYGYLSSQTQTPVPIPEDLTLPFGDFVTKHSLQSSVFNIFSNTEGLGNILSQPSYNVLRELGPGYLYSLSSSSPGVILTAAGNNQELYLRAQAAFGADALVSSTVVHASRGASGVTLIVQTPTGQKQIKASKLLVTMPPTLPNLLPLGLDNQESTVFEKFTPTGFYGAIINVTGLPTGISYQNAGFNTQYNLPVLPGVYEMSSLAYRGLDDLYLVTYGSDVSNLSANTVQEAIVDTAKGVLKAVLGASAAAKLPAPKVLSFADHYPFNLHVSGQNLEAGFYNNLASLQGHLSTWYSGGAFFGYSSSDLWAATDGLVTTMLAS